MSNFNKDKKQEHNYNKMGPKFKNKEPNNYDYTVWTALKTWLSTGMTDKSMEWIKKVFKNTLTKFGIPGVMFRVGSYVFSIFGLHLAMSVLKNCHLFEEQHLEQLIRPFNGTMIKFPQIETLNYVKKAVAKRNVSLSPKEMFFLPIWFGNSDKIPPNPESNPLVLGFLYFNAFGPCTVAFKADCVDPDKGFLPKVYNMLKAQMGSAEASELNSTFKDWMKEADRQHTKDFLKVLKVSLKEADEKIGSDKRYVPLYKQRVLASLKDPTIPKTIKVVEATNVDLKFKSGNQF